MYDFYKSEQLQIINGRANADDRLKYLYKEKERFRADNSSREADNIVCWFDSLIKITEIEISRGGSIQTPKSSHFDMDTNKRIKKSDVDQKITLADFFEHVSKYNAIMEILVKEGHCQQATYIWKDEAKGYRGLIVAIVKQLHHQGFLKRMPTNAEIMVISRNTLHVEIAIDTIKKTKADNFNLQFIPPATTI